MNDEGMLYDPIERQFHGGLKCAKWLVSNAVSSTNMRVIRRLMLNYDTPRQYLNLNWTDF